MAEIKWTEEARTWLLEIREYIAKDNPAAADRIVKGIYEKAQMLLRYPELGFKYPLVARNDVRVLLYGHYRIAYTIFDRNEIHILGVFHSALDIDRFFPEER